MSISTTYGILFEIKALHHYFLNRGRLIFDSMNETDQAKMLAKYDVREVFEIVPTDECRKILNACGCIFKATPTGLLVGLRAESNGLPSPKFKPFADLGNDLIFTFSINIRDYNFMNYTALPFTGNSGQVFLFQNITNGSPKKFPALSVIPPLQENNREYLPGDMLSDNQGIQSRLFTALRKTNAPTTNQTDWLTEKTADKVPLQYVNVNDRHQVVRGIVSYRMKTIHVDPTVTVTTANGITVTPRISVLSGDFKTVQVDLRDFPEGLYTLHIDSVVPAYHEIVSFYLVQQRESPFGIIKIHVKSDSVTYDLLDAQGFLRSPVYELRFRNRATRWKYLGEKFNANSVTDTPLPLTRFGFIDNVKVKGKDGHWIDDLPNPSVPIIKTEALVNSTEKDFYSEIHIN